MTLGVARTIGELKRMSSPHGRTRMIVFPLRRSVELKAATASSRVETLPMFVRSRPSRARRTISLSWARSGTTTKSTVRPSAGRASVGPAMVTSVPPARITRADRFAMSPPRTSNTRSTPPTSSRVSFSRSTNSCAPPARVVAISLIDLRLQHRPHVPRLNTDHRQVGFGKSTEQPLRQRSGFQSNPLEAVSRVPQYRQQSVGFTRDLHFSPHPARVIHNADARVLDRNVQSSKIVHAALLLLMLEAASADLVSPSA